MIKRYSDEELEKLRERIFKQRKKVFSGDPKDIFDEIKRLEDRYIFTIETMRRKFEKIVKIKQKEASDKYQNAIKKASEDAQKEVELLESQVNKNLEDLERQKREILSIMEDKYKEKSQDLLEKALDLIDFKF